MSYGPSEQHTLKNYREEVSEKLAQKALWHKHLKFEKKYLEEAKLQLDFTKNAQEILIEVAQAVEEQAHKHINRIVSKCLKAVWDDPYEFEIKFVRRRGRTEAEMFLTKDGHEIGTDDSTGGGVTDVISFALRMADLSLRMPRGRSFIALDEPFKHVSPDLRPRVAKMLELLSEELGFQFVITTHMRSLKLGTVIEMEKK